MQRRAILIGTNTATSSHLRGVDADMRRLHQHLTSEFGGSWEREEIDYFKAPLVSELRKILNVVAMDRPDFLVIAFSGHGFDDGQGEPFICLRDRQYFAVRDLGVAVDRQIIIIDACRVGVEGSLVEGVIKTAGVGDVSGVDSYRASCRALFDARLRAVATGMVVLQSCSPGQASDDYPTGGLFTHSLVNSARITASNNSNWQRCTKWQSVGNSFAAAKRETQRHNWGQLPTLAVWGQGDELPFVVT